MKTLDGRRALWQWQYSAQGEQDIAAVASTARQYAASDLVLVKAMDGQDWQASFDRTPNAIDSLGTWRQTVADGQGAGLAVLPWVVANRPADAAAHAQLGPVLVVDLEPYAGFWSGAPIPRLVPEKAANPWAGSADEVPGYLAALRAGGVTEIYVSIDPRPQAVAALGVARWAASVDGLLPQLYWTDFSAPAMTCLPMVQSLQALGAAVYPALPYNAAAGDLAAFWGACRSLGCTGASLWRLGSANPAQLRAFGALELPALDPCGGLAQQLSDMTADRDRLAGIVAKVRADVGA